MCGITRKGGRDNAHSLLENFKVRMIANLSSGVVGDVEVSRHAFLENCRMKRREPGSESCESSNRLGRRSCF